MRTLIVGGGIGGLATAISLREAGFDVEVMEISPAWPALTTALTLQSNALAMLGRLGLLEAALAAGAAAPEDLLHVMTFDGAPITDVRYPRIAGPDVPASFGIRRSVMQGIMTGRLEQLGIGVQLGTSPVSIESQAAGDELVVGSDGRKGVYDLVVAADGLRSSVRGLRFRSRDPTYSGFGIWRCTCPDQAGNDQKIMLIGPGIRLGIFPSGADELQVFAFTREPRGARYAPEDWGALMRDRLRAFRGPVPDLLEAASTFHYSAVEHVPAERPFVDGRVVLLGDSAHAAVPFLAQGGAMALEDAVILGDSVRDALAADGSIDTALRHYEARRFPRVAFVQHESMQIGLAWGGDASRYSAETLRATMQSRIDRIYAELAIAP